MLPHKEQQNDPDGPLEVTPSWQNARIGNLQITERRGRLRSCNPLDDGNPEAASGEEQCSAGDGTAAKDEADVVSTADRKTILLAEDEALVCTFVLMALRASGYQVIVGTDGQDALEKSRQFQGTIHLLLSDISMPRMTGLQLATQMQMERPLTPVLLMSALPARVISLNEGWKFLPKPFRQQALMREIQHLLKTSQSRASTAE